MLSLGRTALWRARTCRHAAPLSSRSSWTRTGGGFRALSAGPAKTTFGAPATREEEEEEKPMPTDALKAGAAGSLGLATMFGGLPVSTVMAAGAPPAAFLSAGAITFLQSFPPLAAQACFLAPMDTMKKIKADGDVGNLPLLPFAAMAVNGVGWVAYGMLAGVLGPEASIMDPMCLTIWVPNISAFAFGAYYWKTYADHCKDSPLPWLAGGTAAIGAVGGLSYAALSGMEGIAGISPHFALGLYLNAVVVAMFGGPLGAIKEVNETGNTALIPFPFAVATFVNCSTWAAFGFLVIHDPIVWFPNVLGFGSAVAQLYMHAKFGINNKPAAAEPAAEAAEEKK